MGLAAAALRRTASTQLTMLPSPKARSGPLAAPFLASATPMASTLSTDRASSRTCCINFLSNSPSFYPTQSGTASSTAKASLSRPSRSLPALTTAIVGKLKRLSVTHLIIAPM